MLLPREFKQYTNSRVFIALGGMIAISFIATITAVLAITELLHARQAGQRHNNARFQMEKLLTELETAETGQRGYLITGDPAYLEPYNRVAARLPGELQAAEQQSEGTSYSTGVRQLRPLVTERLGRLKQGDCSI